MLYLDSIFLNAFFSSVVHEAYTFVLNKENNKKNKVICYLSIDFYILGQNNYQAVNVAADVNNNGNLTERGRLYEHQ